MFKCLFRSISALLVHDGVLNLSRLQASDGPGRVGWSADRIIFGRLSHARLTIAVWGLCCVHILQAFDLRFETPVLEPLL